MAMSMRRRLTLLLSGGFAALILLAFLYVESLLDRRLTEEFDTALLAEARTLASRLEQERGAIEFDYEEDDLPQFRRAEAPDYFQIRLPDGGLVRSPSLGEAVLEVPGLPGPEPAAGDVALPDGRAGRAVHLFHVPKGPPEGAGVAPPGVVAAPRRPAAPLAVVVTVARGRERLDAVLRRVRWVLVAAGGAAVLAAVALVWRALLAGLRPIGVIAAQVEKLGAENLAARVVLPRPPRELAPILDQINALLGRLQASFERERRFTGNVAHELRTPIAELRSLAEVGGAWPEDAAAVAGFFGDVRAIAGRMEHIVVDLLLLARCQAGVERVETETLRLRQAVDHAWASLSRNGTAHRFAPDLPGDLCLRTDPGKLDIILSNLLGNAATYALPDSEIRCVATEGRGRFRLEISNPAEPLAPEDLRRMVEPFWRKDEARASAEHAGLGLSLVTALARLLGLEFEVAQDPDGTFRASLEGGVGGPGGE